MFENEQEIASSKHSDELTEPVNLTGPYEHEKSFSEEDICLLHKIIDDKEELVPMKDIDEHSISSVAPMKDISMSENIYVITIHHHKEKLSLLDYYINQLDSLNYVQKKYYNDVKFELYFFTSLPHNIFYDNIPLHFVEGEMSKIEEISLKYKTIDIKLKITTINIKGTHCDITLNLVNILPFDIQIASVEFNISKEELTCECDKLRESGNIVWSNNHIGTKRFVSQLMLFQKQCQYDNNNYYHWQIDYGTKIGIPYYINYVGIEDSKLADLLSFEIAKEQTHNNSELEAPLFTNLVDFKTDENYEKILKYQKKFASDEKATKVGVVLTPDNEYNHLCYAKEYLVHLNKIINGKFELLNDNITEIIASKFDFVLFFINQYDNRDFMHFTTGAISNEEKPKIIYTKTKIDINRSRQHKEKSEGSFRPRYIHKHPSISTGHYDKYYISNIKLFLKYKICYNPYLIISNEDTYLTKQLYDFYLRNILKKHQETEKYEKVICPFYFMAYIKCYTNKDKDERNIKVSLEQEINVSTTSNEIFKDVKYESIFLNLYNNREIEWKSSRYFLNPEIKKCSIGEFIDVTKRIQTLCSITFKQPTQNYKDVRDNMKQIHDTMISPIHISEINSIQPPKKRNKTQSHLQNKNPEKLWQDPLKTKFKLCTYEITDTQNKTIKYLYIHINENYDRLEYNYLESFKICDNVLFGEKIQKKNNKINMFFNKLTNSFLTEKQHASLPKPKQSPIILTPEQEAEKEAKQKKSQAKKDAEAKKQASAEAKATRRSSRVQQSVSSQINPGLATTNPNQTKKRTREKYLKYKIKYLRLKQLLSTQ